MDPAIMTSGRPISADRRTVARSEVIETAARMAWRGMRRSMIQLPARLVDISEKGARIDATTWGHGGSCLWLGLTSLPSEWVRSRVVAIEARDWYWTLRLSFDEPCPPGLLEWAVWGNDPFIRHARRHDLRGPGCPDPLAWDLPFQWD